MTPHNLRRWIIACDGSDPYHYGFVCLGCGARHEMRRPTATLETYITFAQAFVDVHKECKEKGQEKT